MDFYTTFERLCKEKGITPTQAARDNGVAQSVVSMWKKRGSTPKAQTVQKLADYLGVTIDYLLGNDFFSSLSDDELNEMAKDAPTPEQIKRAGYSLRINMSMEKLNLSGLKKAAERVEELTEIPRYRTEPPSRSTVEWYRKAASRGDDIADNFLAPLKILGAGDRPQEGGESTQAPPEGKDTTPPPDAPETAPEGE